jgi:hypothetical protein
VVIKLSNVQSLGLTNSNVFLPLTSSVVMETILEAFIFLSYCEIPTDFVPMLYLARDIIKNPFFIMFSRGLRQRKNVGSERVETLGPEGDQLISNDSNSKNCKIDNDPIKWFGVLVLHVFLSFFH